MNSCEESITGTGGRFAHPWCISSLDDALKGGVNILNGGSQREPSAIMAPLLAYEALDQRNGLNNLALRPRQIR